VVTGGELCSGTYQWENNMVVNPESIPIEVRYECRGTLARYLIYVKSIPLLSKKDGKFYFAKTKILEEVLSNLPSFFKSEGVYR
jgi:hypothetical protein